MNTLLVILFILAYLILCAWSRRCSAYPLVDYEEALRQEKELCHEMELAQRRAEGDARRAEAKRIKKMKCGVTLSNHIMDWAVRRCAVCGMSELDISAEEVRRIRGGRA